LRKFASLTLTLFAADFISKMLVVRLLHPGHPPMELLGSFVRWLYVRNYGSAFSLFHSGRIFFIVFSALSILMILGLARHPRYRTRQFLLAFSLVLGGAFGNLVDRITRGYVVDFIDIGIGDTRWPTFNVADIGVTIGVGFLAFLLLREPHRHGGVEEPGGPVAAGVARDPILDEPRKEGP
jgi:signal peptidase II